MEKVKYRRPDDHKLVFAIVVCRNLESTMLFVPRSDDEHPHSIAIGQDDDRDGIFEASRSNWFLVDGKEVLEIATNLLNTLEVPNE